MDINRTLFWIGHASFYVKAAGKTIFIDPFGIGPGIREKADLVLITHAHYDHCSKDDIRRVMKPGTEIICSRGCLDDGTFKDFTVAEPGFTTEWNGIGIEAVPAYNTNPARLQAHPKANRWVGYILKIEGTRIYHAGDTDFIDEMRSLGALGAALLPIGGTYVMDVGEAINASKAIAAGMTVPMHYKALLGKEGSAAAEKNFLAGAYRPVLMKEVQEPKYGFQ